MKLKGFYDARKNFFLSENYRFKEFCRKFKAYRILYDGIVQESNVVDYNFQTGYSLGIESSIVLKMCSQDLLKLLFLSSPFSEFN